MKCGVCNKNVKKDIKTEDIILCYFCRNIFLKAQQKIRYTS